MAKKARKKKRLPPPSAKSVFKEHLESGTLPRAKTWGKKDQTAKQRRLKTRKELRDGRHD